MSTRRLICFQHGRLKVKTTKEQEEEKRQKRAQKVKLYRAAYGRIVDKRNAGIRDDEGLQISQQILEMIPDIHTLWNYRREILLHFKDISPEEEFQKRLEFDRYLTETCLRANPKSYGAWHHRMWLMNTMPTPDWDRELALCNKYLDLDDRNFHCWDYRRFVVAGAAVPPGQELAFTDAKIAKNFSNYSSWHYRSKLLPQVHPDPQGVRPVQEDRHKHELELVQNAAFTDPNDQSAWFYQRWLLGRSQSGQSVTRAMLSSGSDHGVSFVALAHPARVGTDGKEVQLQFLVNDDPVSGTWQAADGERLSNVWSFTPSSQLPPLQPGAVSVAMDLGGQGNRTSTSLAVSPDGATALHVARPEFGAPLSPALASVMEDELDACKQLLDFDPDSKWTLLTSMLLMQTIDRGRFEYETMDTLGQLIELDYLRANYYKDLRSRLQVEYALERLGSDLNLNLSGRALTALYHAPLLSTLRALDLGSNHLRRPLSQLSALQCCETLVLDGNELDSGSLRSFGAMPSLLSLSLRNNVLSDPADLAPLAGCPRLQSLDVRGNPLCQQANYQEAVRRALDLPSLKTLDGEPL